MALLRWLLKAPLDFEALIEKPTPLSAYRVLRCPMLVLRGERAPRPSRLINPAHKPKSSPEPGIWGR